MGKTVRANRDQQRARDTVQLEKKFDETSRAEDLRRAKKQMESISQEIAESAAAEQQYEQGLMVSFQEMGDETLRRQIESVRQELLSTTAYAQDLIELLAEMEDETARRRDS